MRNLVGSTARQYYVVKAVLVSSLVVQVASLLYRQSGIIGYATIERPRGVNGQVQINVLSTCIAFVIVDLYCLCFC